jgi:hypothetical protein
MYGGTYPNGTQPTFFHRAVRFFRDHERQSWSKKQIEDALLDLEVDGVMPPLFKAQYDNDPEIIKGTVVSTINTAFRPTNQIKEETSQNA